MKLNNYIIKKIWHILLSVGPGIFCIGYTIGTGSVTSMAKSGSQFGMKLLWVLALSCLFSWILMEAYGRFAVITGKTTIHSFKNEFKYGKILAISTVIGVVTGQWVALSGLIGLSANAIYEGIHLFIPGLNLSLYWTVLGIAIVIILLCIACF
jgi:Mn2+/Fe2+ NRAMP family transporter